MKVLHRCIDLKVIFVSSLGSCIIDTQSSICSCFNEGLSNTSNASFSRWAELPNSRMFSFSTYFQLFKIFSQTYLISCGYFCMLSSLSLKVCFIAISLEVARKHAKAITTKGKQIKKVNLKSSYRFLHINTCSLRIHQNHFSFLKNVFAFYFLFIKQTPSTMLILSKELLKDKKNINQ